MNNSGVVAVMQPYVFPYIGYFNLMACASHFVLYDDVNYIKQGWISRNRILNNGNPLTFSVPISQGSSNSQINEVKTVNLERFKKKFLKTLEQAYAKAKYYDVGYEYVDEILGSGENTISNIARLSITYVSEILEMNCKIYESSKYFSETRGAGRSERLINITKKLDCSTYVNSANGSSLYDKKQFECSGLKLKFITPSFVPYKQVNAKEFVPALSIIDLVMNQSVDEIKSHLGSYELI